MTELVHPLPWDSEFFGFPIARVELQGADDTALAAIEDEARDKGIRCAYGTLSPEDTTTSVLAQRHGHRLVEVAITLSHADGVYEPPPTPSKVREGSLDDLPLLADAIDTLGPWSRFGADPRFGAAAARRMFRAWVERAITAEDRMLSISEDEHGITGVSSHVRGQPDRIDLMGVLKPGTGASDAMMRFFFDWARPGPVDAGPCAARNLSVLRFLDRCEFRVSKCDYHFHRWFDEPGWAR
jgi:hypothetical protein